MMRPCEAYALYKQANAQTVQDQMMAHVQKARTYVDEHKGEMAHNVANNITYGLMSNPRGMGSASVFGASAGGVIDGILMRPIADAALHLADKGLRKYYGVAEQQ